MTSQTDHKRISLDKRLNNKNTVEKQQVTLKLLYSLVLDGTFWSPFKVSALPEMSFKALHQSYQHLVLCFLQGQWNLFHVNIHHKTWHLPRT